MSWLEAVKGFLIALPQILSLMKEIAGEARRANEIRARERDDKLVMEASRLKVQSEMAKNDQERQILNRARADIESRFSK